MARVRKYADNAEKQAAYRQRQQQKKIDARPDKSLNRMFIEIKEAAKNGDALAIMLVGENAQQTVSNIAGHFEQFNSSIMWAKLRKGF